MARNLLKYIVVGFISINMVILAVVVWGMRSEHRAPLPNPNGYDDFVKAEQMLKGKPEDYSKMSLEELRGLVATNAEALKVARLGLSRDSRVPVEYSTNWFQQSIPAIMGFKQLAMALAAEGKLAELEGRSNEAAKAYLDGMRLGQESSRGGVIVSRLVGITCEAIGRERLRTLTNNLDAAQCRGIAEALEKIDSKEEPVKETLDQEKRFWRRTSSIKAQFDILINYKAERDLEARFAARIQKNALQRRLVMIAFAARAYELDKGKSPGSISDLVPGYLKAIPQDPTTGTNLVYSPQ